MSLFLLQTAANQALTNVLNSMINSSATQVKDAFAPVLAQMQTYSYGLAATGLLAGMLPLVLGYMFSGQFSYETLFKYLLMAGLFVNYPTLIRLADDVFKQPGEQLENTLKAQSNDGIDLVNAYVTAYTDAVNQYYDNKDAQVSSLDLGARLDIAIDRALKHIGIYIWLAIAMIINMLLDLVLFLLKFASIFGAELLIALSPISFGISFIKGFEGSIIGVLKYIFVIRLWVAVATAIKFAAYNIGFFHLVYKFHAQIDAGSIPASPDWSILVLQAAFIILILLTPMFADALIAGSQSGAFFSAAMAKGTSMLSTASKGAQALGSTLGRIPAPTIGPKPGTASATSKKPGGAATQPAGTAKATEGHPGIRLPRSTPKNTSKKA